MQVSDDSSTNKSCISLQPPSYCSDFCEIWNNNTPAAECIPSCIRSIFISIKQLFTNIKHSKPKYYLYRCQKIRRCISPVQILKNHNQGYDSLMQNKQASDVGSLVTSRLKAVYLMSVSNS